MSVQTRIIEELRKGDRFPGELKDACGTSYREFWKAISQLESEGKICRYFRNTPPSASLCFTLPENQKKPLVVRWNRNTGQGIKPWSPLVSPFKRKLHT